MAKACPRYSAGLQHPKSNRGLATTRMLLKATRRQHMLRPVCRSVCQLLRSRKVARCQACVPRRISAILCPNKTRGLASRTTQGSAHPSGGQCACSFLLFFPHRRAESFQGGRASVQAPNKAQQSCTQRGSAVGNQAAATGLNNSTIPLTKSEAATTKPEQAGAVRDARCTQQQMRESAGADVCM